MEIVINRSFGGFGLSDDAAYRYLERKYPYKNISYDEEFGAFSLDGRNWYPECQDELRVDPVLIEVVKEMGDAANGSASKLKVIEIPDDVKWKISDYDGMETVEEIHRTWC